MPWIVADPRGIGHITAPYQRVFDMETVKGDRMRELADMGVQGSVMWPSRMVRRTAELRQNDVSIVQPVGASMVTAPVQAAVDPRGRNEPTGGAWSSLLSEVRSTDTSIVEESLCNYTSPGCTTLGSCTSSTTPIYGRVAFVADGFTSPGIWQQVKVPSMGSPVVQDAPFHRNVACLPMPQQHYGTLSQLVCHHGNENGRVATPC